MPEKITEKPANIMMPLSLLEEITAILGELPGKAVFKTLARIEADVRVLTDPAPKPEESPQQGFENKEETELAKP